METVHRLGFSILILLLFIQLASGEADLKAEGPSLLPRKMLDDRVSNIHITLCFRARCEGGQDCYCCQGHSPCDHRREDCEAHCTHNG
ncbi:unnamed protein product [Spirodela intermedia]|uniref:Uncharacterized protein n=1 Tax=Spirodela intermedia TaxID=51605 RepID=A0A7I8KC84_SPIIN|nr:unnamed protein product [Spirodela intermedia]